MKNLRKAKPPTKAEKIEVIVRRKLPKLAVGTKVFQRRLDYFLAQNPSLNAAREEDIADAFILMMVQNN